MLATWTKDAGPRRQPGMLDDEHAVRGLGVAPAGQAADDAAADDDAAGDDADEGTIRTLAATDLVEDRLTLIVCHGKTFLIYGFSGNGSILRPGSGHRRDSSAAVPRVSRPTSRGPDRSRSGGSAWSCESFSTVERAGQGKLSDYPTCT